MKKLNLLFILFMFFGCCHIHSDEKPIIKSPYIDSIMDESGNKYYLDTTRMIIYGYDKNDKLLWRTDPWEENNLIVFGGPHPKIFTFKFSLYPNSSSEGVLIIYGNNLGGLLNKANGKFEFRGKD